MKQSVVNDVELLTHMKSLTRTEQDTRPVWIGPGRPRTHVPRFDDQAEWAWKHWLMYEHFLDMTARNEPATVIDVGCGSGHAAVTLADMCPDWRICGMDNDRAILNFARKHNGHNHIEYLEHNALLRIDLSARYVFAVEILEHVAARHHNTLIDNLLHMLQPQGKLFVTTPDVDSMGGAWAQDKPRGHRGVMTRKRKEAFTKHFEYAIIDEFRFDDPLCHFGWVMIGG